jgi:F-type H+-transporting ATPase subunit a
LQEVKIGEHWISHLGPLSVNMDTIITAWLAMAVVLGLTFVLTRKLDIIPNLFQAVGESILGFFEGINRDQIGKDGDKHVAFIASLFLFILISDLFGQLPWKLYHLPQGEFASPTNDLNVTAGLAILVVIYYFYAGISKKGLSFFKHYMQPYWFLLPINILEDFTRPLTLALRLFGNILAGEIMLGFAVGIFPLFLPIPIMFFELFVAVLQALIFTMLTASYIGAVTADHEHEH